MTTFHFMEAHTESGIMGNAYAATKEKGHKLVQAYSDRISDALADPKRWALPV